MKTEKIIFNAFKTNGGNAFKGKIIFNNVTLNVGNGFNSADGTFRAPISGHYKFAFSAIGGIGGDDTTGIDTWVEVYKSGSHEFSIGDSNNGYYSDGNNISYDWIWSLNRGDTVSLKVYGGESYLSSTSHRPVNFNGQLVFVET